MSKIVYWYCDPYVVDVVNELMNSETKFGTENYFIYKGKKADALFEI